MTTTIDNNTTASLPVLTIPELQLRSEIDLTVFDQLYLENLCRQITDRIRARWGARATQRMETGQLPTNLFKDVCARSIMRVLRNPEGITSETQGSYTYSTRTTVASGYLTFTADDELDLIGSSTNVTLGSYSTGLHSRA